MTQEHEHAPKYIVVRDLNSDKLYLDFADTMIRTFERIIARGKTKERLLRRYPSAGDVTVKVLEARQ